MFLHGYFSFVMWPRLFPPGSFCMFSHLNNKKLFLENFSWMQGWNRVLFTLQTVLLVRCFLLFPEKGKLSRKQVYRSNEKLGSIRLFSKDCIEYNMVSLSHFCEIDKNYFGPLAYKA